MAVARYGDRMSASEQADGVENKEKDAHRESV